MQTKLEHLILRNLINNDEYSKKVVPFLKTEYFSTHEDAAIFSLIKNYVTKYNKLPSVDALSIEVDSLAGLSDNEAKSAQEILNEIRLPGADDAKTIEWLVDNTEIFCQEKAIYIAMTEAIDIMNDDSKKQNKGIIPNKISEALAVSFDTSVGHDYLADFLNRYMYMHKKEAKLQFDLDMLNHITNGGIPLKTLNVILAGTGIGKTLFMCHLASSYLLQGKNVLYITLEMAEEKIAERIDANLFDTTMDNIKLLPQDMFSGRVAKIKGKTNGQLIIKEYPTSQASTIHFQALLNDLYLKKSFKPDVVFIDYINICASSRFKPGSGGMYEYVKAVAEELRGLAVEKEFVIWTATQTNRAGFTSSDVGLENTAESFGLPATADFMFSLMVNETLEENNLILVKQLKNRYSEISSKNRRFYIGVDKSRMRLYNARSEDQEDLPETEIPSSHDGKSTSERFRELKS